MSDRNWRPPPFTPIDVPPDPNAVAHADFLRRVAGWLERRVDISQLRRELTTPDTLPEFLAELDAFVSSATPDSSVLGVFVASIRLGSDGRTLPTNSATIATSSVQPETDAELQRAINAMHVQDLGCIRYGGSDSSVLSRLTSTRTRRTLRRT